jgi:cytochrome c oxidase subunit IV
MGVYLHPDLPAALSEEGGMASRPEAHAETGHGHPNYVGIAIFLFVVTAAEVAIAVASLPDGFTTVTLFVLMFMKAAGVAGYYMHLRFDSRVFSYLFLGGSVVALGLILAVAALYGLLPGQ